MPNKVMMNKENLIKNFRSYSSKTDVELMLLIDEYISTGRRRKALLKSIVIIILLSCLIGALTGFIKVYFSVEDSTLFSGIAGGIIGGLSVLTMLLILRIDIKAYLKSEENKRY